MEGGKVQRERLLVSDHSILSRLYRDLKADPECSGDFARFNRHVFDFIAEVLREDSMKAKVEALTALRVRMMIGHFTPETVTPVIIEVFRRTFTDTLLDELNYPDAAGKVDFPRDAVTKLPQACCLLLDMLDFLFQLHHPAAEDLAQYVVHRLPGNKVVQKCIEDSRNRAPPLQDGERSDC